MTGEVVYFDAQAIDNEGDLIETIPFIFSFAGVSESPSEYASGMIKNNARHMTAEQQSRNSCRLTAAVMSAQNEPRYATLPNIMKAR